MTFQDMASNRITNSNLTTIAPLEQSWQESALTIFTMTTETYPAKVLNLKKYNTTNTSE